MEESKIKLYLRYKSSKKLFTLEEIESEFTVLCVQGSVKAPKGTLQFATYWLFLVCLHGRKWLK